MTFRFLIFTLILSLTFHLSAMDESGFHRLEEQLSGLSDFQKIIYLDRLIEEDNSENIYLLKSRIELRVRDYYGAIETLEEAKLHFDNAEILSNLALAYFHAGNTDEAEKLFNRVIKNYDNNSLAKFYLKLINPIEKTGVIPQSSLISIDTLYNDYLINSKWNAQDTDYVVLKKERRVHVKSKKDYDYEVEGVVLLKSRKSIETFRNFTMPYNKYEFTPDVKWAVTIDKSSQGSVKHIKNSNITSVDSNSGGYSNQKFIKFPFPDLKEGVLLAYKIYFHSNGNNTAPGWADSFLMGAVEPVYKQNLTIKLPVELQDILKVNSDNIKEYTSYDQSNVYYTYDTEDPQMIDLTGETASIYDIAPMIVYTSFDSWDEGASWYNSLFKNALTNINGLSAKAGLDFADNSRRDVVKEIYHYIQQNIRYEAVELGAGAIKPRKVEETLVNKFGDCKDQTALFIAFLQENGIEAYPALIFTGSRMPVDKATPYPFFYNHVITYIPEQDGINKEMFLDTTANFTPFDNLPSVDQGREAFVITNKGYDFKNTPVISHKKNYMKEEYVVKINQIGKADIHKKEEIGGSFAEYLHQQLGTIDKEKFKEYIYQLEKKLYPDLNKDQIEVFHNGVVPDYFSFELNSDFKNYTEINYDGTLKMEYNVEDVLSLFSIPEKSKYDFTMGFLFEYERSLEYVFPEGYEVVEQNLETVNFQNKYMSISFLIDKIKDNRFKLIFKVALKERTLKPEDLEEIRKSLVLNIRRINYNIALRNTGSFDQRDFYEKLIVEYPEIEVYQKFISYLVDEKDYQRAYEVSVAGLDKFKGVEYFPIIVNLIHIELKEYKEAEDVLLDAIASPKIKNKEILYTYLINLYTQTENIDGMNRILPEASGKYPNNEDILQQGVDFYNNTKQFDKALALLDRAIEGDSKNSYLYASKGYIYSLMDEFDKAESLFKKSIELDEKNAIALNNLAWLYCEHKTKLDDGVKYATKAVELDPRNDNYLDTLAEVYFLLEQYDDAIDVMKKAISINPNYTYLQQQLKKIERAKGEKAKEKADN